MAAPKVGGASRAAPGAGMAKGKVDDEDDFAGTDVGSLLG